VKLQAYAIVGRTAFSTNSGKPIRQPRQDFLHALMLANTAASLPAAHRMCCRGGSGLGLVNRAI